MRRFLAMVIAFSSFGSPQVAAVEVENQEQLRQRHIAAGRVLLDAGKYDEALMAYGASAAHVMCWDLRDRALAPEAAPAEAERLLGLYFLYFPFGNVHPWSHEQSEWNQLFERWLDIRAKNEATDKKELRIERAAFDRYQHLVSVQGKVSLADARQLAFSIAKLYPRSRIAPAALLAFTEIVVPRLHPGPAATAIYEEVLQLMEQCSVSPELQVQLLLNQGDACRQHYKERFKEGAAVYQRAGRATAVTYGKRLCEVRAIELLLWNTELRERGRAAALDFISQAPFGQDFWSLCSQVIETLIADNQGDAALAQLTQFEEREGAEQYLSELRLQIAKHMLSIGEQSAAIDLLTKTVADSPLCAPLALVELGDIHRSAGATELAIDAYRRAVESSASTFVSLRVRDRVCPLLGYHYMKLKDWQEARRWWQQWESASWCGNAHVDVDRKRDEMIKLCDAKLTGK